MARAKTKRTKPRPKKQPSKQPHSSVWLIVFIGVLFGAALGISVLGLYQLFRSADEQPVYRSVVLMPSRTPTAAPIPAGWKQTEEYSVPILMYHYIRSMPPRDRMGQGLSVSPEQFAKQLDYLIENGYVPITFAQLSQGILPPKPVILTFDDGLADAYTAAFPALRQRGLAGTFYVISGFVGQAGSVTWDQLREMQAAGMEIGAHTVTHPDLAIASPAEQQHQIDGSIRAIQETLGQPVITFAYPSGKQTPQAVELLETAGISYSVTTKDGLATDSDNQQLLPRYRITDATDFGALLPKD